MVRGAVVLPHGTGKSQRVIVVAKGDKANEARAAGADAVGAEDLVEKIQKENWTDFDSMVATPDMMGLVGRLGRVLGPKGLMPNPKVGTVTNDVAKAVRELKAGRVEFRVEKAGIVQARIGKVSFGGEKLRDERPHHDRDAAAAKPASAKGTYMRSVTSPRRWARASRSTTCRWWPSSRPSSRQPRQREQAIAWNGQSKKRTSTRLKGELAKATSLVLADFRGITVKNDTALRREFRLNGCKYQVVKNTLLGTRGRGHGAWPGWRSCSWARPPSPTRSRIRPRPPRSRRRSPRARRSSSSRAATSTARPDVKGVEALSKLPAKDELRSTFLALLVAAPQNFLGLLDGRAAADLRYLLAAREQSLGEGGEASSGDHVSFERTHR